MINKPILLAWTCALLSLAAAGQEQAEVPAVEVTARKSPVYLRLCRYLAAQRAYAALKKKKFAPGFTADSESESLKTLQPEKKAKALALIKQLGDDSYVRREEASKQLAGFGEVALPLFVSESGKHKDPEIVSRLETLIEALRPDPQKLGPVQLLGVKKSGLPLPWYRIEADFAQAVTDGKTLDGYRFSRLAVDSAGEKLGSTRHAILAVPAEAGEDKLCFLAFDDIKKPYGQILAMPAGGNAVDKSLPLKPAEAGWKRVDPLPGSAKKRVDREANAVGSCRAYASAQTMYHRNDWDRNGRLEYTPRFGLLAATPDGNGNAIQLLDSAMMNATSPQKAKHGYFFVDMMTIDGSPIIWADDYGLCAVPAEYGKTGIHTFIISTNGTVFKKDTGGKPVFDYPADMTAAGWVIAE